MVGPLWVANPCRQNATGSDYLNGGDLKAGGAVAHLSANPAHSAVNLAPRGSKNLSQKFVGSYASEPRRVSPAGPPGRLQSIPRDTLLGRRAVKTALKPGTSGTYFSTENLTPGTEVNPWVTLAKTISAVVRDDPSFLS